MDLFRKKGDRQQVILILLGVVATVLFAIFFLREWFPEYKLYQGKFVELENFRAEMEKVAPAPFSYGVKQLVFEREDKGPALVDRCTSCHLALEIEEYSPVIVVRDEKGHPLYDEDGFPKKAPNANYLFARLDREIERMQREGRGEEASTLARLKTVASGDNVYSSEKVLRAHPLMGKEIRAFQYHPVEEYGCTSCHNGNGNALTVDKAHGPLSDGKYEEEFMGVVPEFLERDPVNDPPFSKLFNHKPGSKLLFQTTPVYVGGLMEAKCVQCHLTAKQEKEIVDGYLERNELPRQEMPKRFHEVDLLTKSYQRGEELFFSQACYACHRIGGLSRGGIGPDLSREGFSYPWFVKESIVWPQADLKTSTMPNFRLDHEEVEDLMAFLLAQRGERKAYSGTPYKRAMTAWENGAKRDFERAIERSDVVTLDAGVRLFAEGGCASCHRLEGVESSWGVEEKDRVWFRELFGENIGGKALAEAIDKEHGEIDRRIVQKSKAPMILDKIDEGSPGLLSTFYPPFQYAKRAKDHVLDEKWREEYQARLHRVLLAYIEMYGLGRQIGPKLNWSGIYRSDQWLMQHFLNPGSKIPRSIMPVFPYDVTKFYALTYMLDAMAKKNGEKLREEWKGSGFQPKLAYQLLCSQCHGEYMQGNGPVAGWIYPVPKNLRSQEFMANMTKEEVVKSIMHGVPGTPMPPWGEAVEGKGMSAVLTQKQAEELAVWLFAFVHQKEEVPKWRYASQDVMQELQSERSPLAAQELFDPALGMIKRSLYTPANMAKGEAFFLENCAACHGKEADGQSLRAEAMHDAKPRMLTNQNWLAKKDDLYLLRSIKFGVPGTSMTPWGDLTTAEQRIALVVYIRSLSAGKLRQDQLQDALYKRFDQEDFTDELGAVSYDRESLRKQKLIFQALGMQILAESFGLSQTLFPLLLKAIATNGDPAKELDEMISIIDTLKTNKKLEKLRAALISARQELIGDTRHE